ncbi:hypothetical protein SS50377_23559 [Spironucleus salmonicida]|uniref:Uncharacterized protein n=1 Tax=Spironucleus salmonicida TaxID=348837 RepID=V6LXV2_9EUKA|nr:hypothetical protein SS50377_23559 [Spironucleus salmonicida]|eukprot:EST48541.1 Hypothetical protein SS50377_11152 [Spironucleus salmonicida]
MKQDKLSLSSNTTISDQLQTDSFKEFTKVSSITANYPHYNLCVILNKICFDLASQTTKSTPKTPAKHILTTTPATAKREVQQTLPEMDLPKSFETDANTDLQNGAKHQNKSFSNDIFSDFSYLTPSTSNFKQIVISTPQIEKAREICAYLSSIKRAQIHSKSQLLKILDSLRIVSDFIGIKGGNSVVELIQQVTFYFEAILGCKVEFQAQVDVQQLYVACCDYVSLGKVAVHYWHSRQICE